MNRKNIELNTDIIYDINDLIKQILYHGSIIKTNIHEINHEFYNILFLLSKGFYPIETPRKKKLAERESGKNLEMLLFNRRVTKMTIQESMYILNEKNYEKI